jgi:hypothetical protein
MDINFLGASNGSANWMHINSVQYNESLDQIILSSKTLSEIYIIDHSTTTAEAQTNLGGTYGKGGDLLYRWGNPISYKQGEAAQTNNVFRVKKYGLDYAAFTGRDLSPKPPIEKEYNLSNCNTLSVPQNPIQTLAIYPNPVKDILYINGSDLINKVEVYTNYGSKVKVSLNKNKLDMSSLSAGIYQIRIFYSEKITYSKIIKL